MDKEDRERLIRVDERTVRIEEGMGPLLKKVDRHEKIIWMIIVIASATGAILLAAFDGVGLALIR